MRQLFILLITAVVGLSAQAQISGSVKDTEGKALSGVTMSLLKDSTVVKLSVTKPDGNYTFSGISEGVYRISASHVGYDTEISAPVTVNGTEVKVPSLQLSKSSNNLQGVTVQARKPMVEVKADKMVVNVEGTINATGNDALELLRKSPGVMVDKDENLSVSGKNGVQVHIDGRPTPLAGQDLAQYLKTLQSSQIEAIEIITNPGAKYEAAGNAGIINIKLKKNKNFGTNGSVNLGFNYGELPKYNGGVSLNHRNKDINVYGNYNYNNIKNQSIMELNRSLLDTLFQQRNKMRMDMQGHNFKVGADYTINKESSIGALVTGNFAAPSLSNQSITPIVFIPTGETDRVLVANNSSDMDRDNVTANLNYNYATAKGKSLTLNADYGQYKSMNDQLQPNVYYTSSGDIITSASYQMISPTDIYISSLKADYESNFAKGKLGFGGKSAYITTDNDFQRFNINGTTKELDLDRSNRFEYKENINAGYVNYNRALKGWQLQAGVRVEHTNTEGTSTGMKDEGAGYEKYTSVFERDYVDFFPSAAITFNKNPMKQWNLTYSRRIDRPAYQDLNPFEFKLDEYTFQKGNTSLKPQYTNSIALTHTYKYKLNMKLSYSHVKDIFTQLIDTAEKSKAFMSKQNLATQDLIALNVSYPFMYKNFTSFINMNTNYSEYKADFGEGREIDLDAFALSVFMQNSLKFGKTKKWTAELTGFYNAPTIWQGAFQSETLWSVDAGIQKQIFKGNGTVKASFSDLFNSLQFKGKTEFAGQVSNVRARWESQQLKMSFSYRFGNSQVKAAKQRNTGAEDETKRVQNGGGGIGIGQ